MNENLKNNITKLIKESKDDQSEKMHIENISYKWCQPFIEICNEKYCVIIDINKSIKIKKYKHNTIFRFSFKS